MSEQFDAYYEWLGIPPKDQPPNHYRLLGVELFEQKLNVIEHAADQRMAHLRTLQTGRHSALSQRLLNEVAAARVCLLKPDKKAAYDAQLRAQLPPQAERSDDSLDSGLKEAIQQAQTRKPVAPSKPPPNLRVLVAAGAGLAVLLLALIVWWAASGRKTEVASGSTAGLSGSAVADSSRAVPAPEGRKAIAQGASPGETTDDSRKAPQGRQESPPTKPDDKTDDHREHRGTQREEKKEDKTSSSVLLTVEVCASRAQVLRCCPSVH